jgi:CRISPR system Cascade subunit CasA
VELGLQIKTALRNKLYGFGKRIQLTGIADLGEDRFYRISEPEIHRRLRSMSWSEASEQLDEYGNGLAALARQVFSEVTMPYQHEPKMIAALATARNSLARELNKILRGE